MIIAKKYKTRKSYRHRIFRGVKKRVSTKRGKYYVKRGKATPKQPAKKQKKERG